MPDNPVVPAGIERLVTARSSFARLPEDVPQRRRPRAPSRHRPASFHEGFESRMLFYDAFWNDTGECILLVGPPPLNLRWEYASARYSALPLDYWLEDTMFPSQSVMITQLADVPRGTRDLLARIAGRDFVLPIRENHAAAFAGRNVLFTMSKDNELAWIAEWARYHVSRQGVDAIVFFDNGSTRYSTADIERTLLAVPGLEKVAVLSWPFIYGATDRAVVFNPFYTLFCQVAAMSVTLRRFAPRARGLLNLDIDELVETPAGTTIFDLLARTRQGLIVMQGRYMEALPDGGEPGAVRTHRDFPFVLRDRKAAVSRQKKWALDPGRAWVRNLAVHPYMHWIHGRPLFGKSRPDGVFYRHFRGINTNWKDNRADAAGVVADELERDPGFAELFAGIDRPPLPETAA